MFNWWCPNSLHGRLFSSIKGEEEGLFRVFILIVWGDHEGLFSNASYWVYIFTTWDSKWSWDFQSFERLCKVIFIDSCNWSKCSRCWMKHIFYSSLIAKFLYFHLNCVPWVNNWKLYGNHKYVIKKTIKWVFESLMTK